MTHKALDIQNLSVSYGNNIVLDNISFTMPQSVIAAIVGPNGAGKSTLVKAILGFIQPKQGTITILGKSLIQNRKKIAYIPQRADIDWDFPATVYDVILMGRYPHIPLFRSLKPHDHEIAKEALIAVGLEQYQNTPISKLSGGQQQLCFLARAFAQKADLYILDEPFIGIDAPTEKKIITLLRNLKSLGKTILVIHHDLYTLKEYFDWLLLLNHSVVAQGPTDILLSNDTYITQTYKKFDHSRNTI